jgi:hypothetical protein
MTGVALAADRSAPATSHDVRPTAKRLLALVVPVGPFAVALLRYVLPYDSTSTPEQLARGVMADPGRQSLVLWLALIAVFTLVPAVLGVARLTRRLSPRLTFAALFVLVPGYLALPYMAGTDLLLWTGARAGLDAETLTRLATTTHPTAVIAEGVFVVGHVGGTILLGTALWRTRAVPRWAAMITIISQPLHFTAAVILASHSLDLLAWSLNGIGFAVAALAILRLPVDEWDLPPT